MKNMTYGTGKLYKWEYTLIALCIKVCTKNQRSAKTLYNKGNDVFADLFD